MYSTIGRAAVFPIPQMRVRVQLHLLSFFSKIGGIKMKRLIDWFRKPAIMHKLFHTGGEWDGDLVTYKHHKYYVNAQTGVVFRIE